MSHNFHKPYCHVLPGRKGNGELPLVDSPLLDGHVPCVDHFHGERRGVVKMKIALIRAASSHS